MEILGQTPVQSILFFTLFGVTGVVPLIAALYLLLCPVNAIAPGVTPPLRLRRWTAAFFVVATLAHLWWLLFIIYSFDFESLCYQLIILTDSILLLATKSTTLERACKRVYALYSLIAIFIVLRQTDILASP